MKITPTLTALLTRTEGPARDFLQSLSPGQTLQAKVVDVPSAGTARLQIGLMELLAQTKAQLSPGQTLELEVKQLKPLPELKILNPPPSRPPSDQVLQQALPRQIPVREVIQQLQRLLAPEPGKPGSTRRPAVQTATAPANSTAPMRAPVRTPIQARVQPAATGQTAGASPHPSAGGIQTEQKSSQALDNARLTQGVRSSGTLAAKATVSGPTPPATGTTGTGTRGTGIPPAAGKATSPASSTPSSATVGPQRPLATTTPVNSPASGPVAASIAKPSTNPGSTSVGNPATAGPAPAGPVQATPGSTAATPPPGSATLIQGQTAANTPTQAQPPSAASSPLITTTPSAATPTPAGPAVAPRPSLEQLPKPVQLAIQQLLRPAPQAQQLNGTQVRQQLSESGLFLERQLAQGAIPKADNKLDMLRLSQLLIATRTQTGLDRTRPETAASAHTTTRVRPGTPPVSIAHLPENPLPSQPPTAIPALTGGSVTGGLTEQLLRLLTGAGRRPGAAAPASPGSTTTTTAQQPTTAAPLDPRHKAEQLLQTMQAGKDARTGPGEAARSGEASTRQVAATQRALTDRLLQLVEGGLARVQTHQAATLAQAEDGRQMWQFELPLGRAQERDEVLIRLERESVKQDTSEESRWTATLRFAFDNLGSVEARLMLEGDRLSSTFWCERAETEQRFARRLPELEQGLHKVGLEIGRLSAVQGTPPNPLDLPKPPTGLLDTHV